MVKGVDEEGIHVRAPGKGLEQRLVIVHREDAEILAEVRGRLATLFADVTAVRIGVEKGVVQMIGVVPDEAVRRQAEETARSIDGVIGVENILYADTSIALRVTAALSADPRTSPAVDLGRIRVNSNRGTVTLEGEVPSPEARTAAAQMAAGQPGVFTVVNRLEIEGDSRSGASGWSGDEREESRQWR
jgi:osmotically-inducible protein OsmY